ncbi:MAG: hypothetical protein K5864_04510 [Bacteroidales bacterium]|nr:hypothetical protein [Bacteroidales bacterium]
MKRLLLLAFFLSEVMAFAQMPKVDYPYAKLIEKGDFEKAAVNILKDYQKDSSDVLACYAYYRLLSETSYPQHDYAKAYSVITRTCQLYESLEEKTRKKLEKKNVTQYILQDDMGIATDKWLQSAIDSNNPSSLETFLTSCTYATESQKQHAIQKRNTFEFNIAKSINTAAAYQYFIDKRPNADEVPTAIQLRNKVAYYDAALTNTMGSYQDFVRRYPDAKEVPDATANIHRIAYAHAQAINTIESYQSFVDNYPDAKEVEDAKSNIQEKNGGEVSLIVTADGASKTEAVNNALRLAIEQTFGTFVSANTEILNDQLVKDEIATISSGNIQKYRELSSDTLPNGNTSVTLHVTVSLQKLVKYAQSKGSECEFAGATFGANLRLYEFNKRNEQIAIENMIKQLNSLRPIFDYSISVSDPIINDPRWPKNYSLHGDYNKNEYSTIKISVNCVENKTTELFLSILRNTIHSLAKSYSDIYPLQQSGFKFYEYNSGFFFNPLPDDLYYLLDIVKYDFTIEDNNQAKYFIYGETQWIHKYVVELSNIKDPDRKYYFRKDVDVTNISTFSYLGISGKDCNNLSVFHDIPFIVPIEDIPTITQIKVKPTLDQRTTYIFLNNCNYHMSAYFLGPFLELHGVQMTEYRKKEIQPDVEKRLDKELKKSKIPLLYDIVGGKRLFKYYPDNLFGTYNL